MWLGNLIVVIWLWVLQAFLVWPFDSTSSVWPCLLSFVSASLNLCPSASVGVDPVYRFLKSMSKNANKNMFWLWAPQAFLVWPFDWTSSVWPRLLSFVSASLNLCPSASLSFDSVYRFLKSTSKNAKLMFWLLAPQAFLVWAFDWAIFLWLSLLSFVSTSLNLYLSASVSVDSVYRFLKSMSKNAKLMIWVCAPQAFLVWPYDWAIAERSALLVAQSRVEPRELVMWTYFGEGWQNIV